MGQCSRQEKPRESANSAGLYFPSFLPGPMDPWQKTLEAKALSHQEIFSANQLAAQYTDR